MKRKIIIISFLLFGIIFTQTACWDRKEVEDLAIVLAIGVEPASGNKIKIILQNVNPSSVAKGAGGGGAMGLGTKSYRNRSAEAETIFDAIRELSRQVPQQLFFAHNQIIIISEDLAQKRGINDIIDFLERNPQIRRNTWILVGRGELATLLDEPGRLETTPSQRIFNIINQRDLSSKYAIQRLGDFLEMMESKSIEPYTAIVEYNPNPAVPKDHKHDITDGQAPEPHYNIEISGTAAFHGEKMVGWLNSEESRGLLWVRGDVKGGIIDILSPDEQRKPIALEILSSKTKLEPQIKDGQIFMNINVKTETNVGETTSTMEIAKPEVIKKLEALLAVAVQDEIEAALDKAQQEYNTDVFGFGEVIHRKYPSEWKQLKENWSDLFPSVQVQIAVEAKIRRIGLVSNPLKPEQH